MFFVNVRLNIEFTRVRSTIHIITRKQMQFESVKKTFVCKDFISSYRICRIALKLFYWFKIKKNCFFSNGMGYPCQGRVSRITLSTRRVLWVKGLEYQSVLSSQYPAWIRWFTSRYIFKFISLASERNLKLISVQFFLIHLHLSALP